MDPIFRAATPELTTLWGSSQLEGRFEVDDLAIAFRTDSSLAGPMEAPIMCASGYAGPDFFQLFLPGIVVDALFSRAPDGAAALQYTPRDSALIFEHLLTEQLDFLETKTGYPIQVDTVSVLNETMPEHALPFRLRLAGRIFVGGFTVMGTAAADALIENFLRKHSLTPKYTGELPVALGPVYIDPVDLQALGPSDVLVIDQSGSGALLGALFLDATTIVDIEVGGGKATIKGSPYAATRSTEDRRTDGSLALYVEIGVARITEAAAPGSMAPIAPFGDDLTILRMGSERVGLGKLVNIGDDIAVRIERMGVN
jgi:hypothetical protein